MYERMILDFHLDQPGKSLSYIYPRLSSRPKGGTRRSRVYDEY